MPTPLSSSSESSFDGSDEDFSDDESKFLQNVDQDCWLDNENRFDIPTREEVVENCCIYSPPGEKSPPFSPSFSNCCVNNESSIECIQTREEVVDCCIHSSHGEKSPPFSPSFSTSNEPREVSFYSDAGRNEDAVIDEPVITSKQVNAWNKIFQKPATATAASLHSTEPVVCPEVGGVINIPMKYLHDGFSYTKRNTNIKEVQYKCMHERTKKFDCCTAMLYLPLTKCRTKVIACPRLVNPHTFSCAEHHGKENDYNWAGKMTEAELHEVNEAIESPSKKLRANDAGEIHQPNIDARVPMRILAEELAIKKLAARPKDIAIEVYNLIKIRYPNGCIVEDDKKIAQLVSNTRKSMGQGNNISTVEMAYSKMKGVNRAFLHFSGEWPHPTDPDKKMRMMIFGNPTLINLLRNPTVDLFVDATFSCCPPQFHQCLIIMVYEHQTRSYVPVLYILMTHKFESQYVQAFFQVSMLIDQKIAVRTYTSDFERGLMNGLERIFGGEKGGIHIGCFFHLKQAWRKYLVETVKMPSDAIVKRAMKIGSLDLLCIIPQDEVEEYGIPYLQSLFETKDETDDVKDRWKLFWKYFYVQWIPIIKDWNICARAGEYITLVNRTNNGIESYNNRINELYTKKPSMIEFVTTLEEESVNQATNWLKIATGEKQDNVASRQVPTVPEIPDAYTNFKEKLKRKIKRDSKKAKAAATAVAKATTAAPMENATKSKKGKK